MQKNLVIVIGGSTASGKSALAMDIARAFDGIIINTDSMQLYKDTPILSACPTNEDKAEIPHVLYEVFESSTNGTVFDWLNLAKIEIKKAWEQGKMPIIVGGSGMYIDCLINGMSPIPQTSEKTKYKVSGLLDEIGASGIHKILAEKDSQTAQKLNPNDTTRTRRAYEVFLDTGKTMSAWHEVPNEKPLPEATFFVIKIIPSKEEIDERCFGRFDKMIKQGALEEVKNLKKLNLNKDLPAMKALGVPELLDFLDGKTSLEEAVELAKLHTRQYAKRQRTWFSNKLKANKTLESFYKSDKYLIEQLKKILH